MIVKAPGVVKLLGEHAVVYGKLAVAVSINIYAKASVSKAKSKMLIIDIPQFGKKEKFSVEELSNIYKLYKSRKGIDDYLANLIISEHMLPFVTIAARLYKEFGIDPLGLKIRLSSDIPLQKGLASSAALSTAFAIALIKNSGVKLSDQSIIDVARDGDRIIHKNENAGRIDVSTSFYGGYTTFSSQKGSNKEDIRKNLKLLIVDTGPKKTTAETVGYVAKLYDSDKGKTATILDKIEECSIKGLDAARKGDIKTLGKYMYEDHYLLASLGVSSDGLDRAVKIAKEENARGAKLSGGGGGGIAIVLSGRNKQRLSARFVEQGFSVIETKISSKGAKDYL